MVITDTDCFGNVTTNLRPAGIILVSTFDALPIMLFNSARPLGTNPSTLIVVVNEFVELVFTALIKIPLPLLLAVTSR
jgi:hypothetical protein